RRAGLHAAAAETRAVDRDVVDEEFSGHPRLRDALRKARSAAAARVAAPPGTRSVARRVLAADSVAAVAFGLVEHRVGTAVRDIECRAERIPANAEACRHCAPVHVWERCSCNVLAHAFGEFCCALQTELRQQDREFLATNAADVALLAEHRM